ncbi:MULTISPECIES: hypothetical protein [Pseudomonadaceae]|jgi:hypothetical protein|uniref:Uncharacterized protein n=2 Tax=Pseudomonadaceae TaxID=135621 RepID=F6AEZ7_PSEF1|nr:MULTISPECIES: hypothetical protein [Pseudomonas]AEF23641.1 hypothetical protein Psefu_3680 [Pseudomonas fulva 12-X]PZW67921.1 hypothetical protein F471_02683 [Pseudomonas sp. URMO17WK12:I1]TWE10675.1 hypothetical protein FB481_101164 [Pseudomonas sp. AG1028]SFD83957.1 hypothetical protein SAMN05216372_104480 [Pseudomonas straminea]GLX13329.1 hypothetical protein Pstr01_15680 [Pseudomonas straminea]
MSPLHELIVANRRSLRYALGFMLVFAGGLIIAVKILDGATAWFF